MTAYEMRISDWDSDVCSSDVATAKHRDVPLACQARTPPDSRRTIGDKTVSGLATSSQAVSLPLTYTIPKCRSKRAASLSRSLTPSTPPPERDRKSVV